MSRRMLMGGLAMWLGVILVGSGITWLVIDQVGRSVVTDHSALADPAPRGPEGTSATSRTASPTPKPAAKRTARPTKSPSAPQSSATAPTETPKPAGSTRSQEPAPPRTVTRTWSGPAGRVTVSCSGSRATLMSASPSDGWRVEVEKRGPVEVEVSFSQSGEGGESHVHADCSGGQPQFKVEQDH